MLFRVATERCRHLTLSTAHRTSVISTVRLLTTSAPPPRVERILRRSLLARLQRFTEKKPTFTAAMSQENSSSTRDKTEATASHESITSALPHLIKEIASIRASLPSWLEAVSDPVPARWVVPKQGERRFREAPQAEHGVALNPNPESGPWHIHISIRGPVDSGYDVALYRVRLTFTPQYPYEPPDVHVLSHCHHALVDGNKEVAGLFYHPDNCPPMRIHEVTDPATEDKIVSKVEYDLRGLLACVHIFFARPLRIPGPDDDVHLKHQREQLEYAWADAKDSNTEREKVIAAYVTEGVGDGPKDPRLFDADTGWLPQWMHPDLFAIMREGEGGKMKLSITDAKHLCKEEAPGIYTFPLFSDEFCDALIAEVEHFQRSGLPVRRPNSMNNYGCIINEIGMERMIDRLQSEILSPVAEALFPSQGGGALDGHHSFIVQYKQGEDLGLDMHTDDSDITFNVCLGKESFTGAGLSFCGLLGGPVHRKLSLVYKHVKGRCVVHLGTHRHGADDIQLGERLNLIIWNHSTLYRSTKSYKW